MKRFISLVLGLSLGLVALAQPAAPSGRVVAVEFQVFLAGPPIEPVRYQAGGEVRTVTLAPQQRTGPFKYSGPARLAFIRPATAGARTPDGKAVPPQVVGTVEFPEGATKVLLFFVPETADASVPCKIVAISDALTGFPAGSALFFNGTPIPLDIAIGPERLHLLPGPSVVMPLGRRPQPVHLEFTVTLNGAPPQVVSAIDMDFTTDARRVILLLPPKRPGSRRIQVISADEMIFESAVR